MARAQREMYERLPRMVRHRIRVHNERLKSHLHNSGVVGHHVMRREEGIVWFFVEKGGKNYQCFVDALHGFEEAHGVRYQFLLNPKGMRDKDDWIWIVPDHETFSRPGDEQFEWTV